LSAGQDQQRREIHYSGWVQGVGFRFTACRLASVLPVTGYVRNLRDGRVELVVEGSASNIDRLLAAIREELAHHIHDVSQSSAPATGEFHSFEIRR
jgi:acylphosphatase